MRFILAKTETEKYAMNITNIQYKPSLASKNITNMQEYVGTDDGIAAVTLDSDGTILDCNQSASVLLNCSVIKPTWLHISEFFPQLAEITLLIGESINPKLRFLSRVGYHFEVIAMNGLRFASKLYFVDIDHLGDHYLRLIIVPASQN